MGLLNLASANSAWKGYVYYKNNFVMSKEKISDSEYKGIVKGSGDNKYEVYINIDHPRKSKCNCPHADGRVVICKHKVALYFSFFPEKAEEYYRQYIEAVEEAEREQEELEEKVDKYIDKLSKKELREELKELLFDGPEWQFNRFVNEHIYCDDDYDDEYTYDFWD